jgi:hypothetical protein
LKKVLLLAAIAAVAWFLNRSPAPVLDTAPGPDAAEAATDPIAAAFAARRSDVPVTGSGRVSRLLGDDSLGDRHQRFILALDSGQSLLVAHNIDLAPRVGPLAVGDTVEFHGVYEWNDKGGVVHWTHHDPEGRHDAGWIRHRGRTYE